MLSFFLGILLSIFSVALVCLIYELIVWKLCIKPARKDTIGEEDENYLDNETGTFHVTIGAGEDLGRIGEFKYFTNITDCSSADTYLKKKICDSSSIFSKLAFNFLKLLFLALKLLYYKSYYIEVPFYSDITQIEFNKEKKQLILTGNHPVPEEERYMFVKIFL